MENISNWLSFANGTLKVPAHELFQTIDLYEAKNMVSVLDAIFSFSRHAAAAGYTGKLLPGPKLAERNSRTFSEEQLNEGKKVIGLQMGYSTGLTTGLGTGKRDIDSKIG